MSFGCGREAASRSFNRVPTQMDLPPFARVTIFNIPRSIVLLLAVFALGSPALAQPRRPWMNKSLPADERANLLLNQMTLDEKMQVVHGSTAFGLSGFARPKGALGGDGFAPGVPRLGIPDLQLVGAGVGVTNLGRRRNGQATALPSSLAETASWDAKLAYDFGAVIGRKTRDQGFNVSLGGGIDLARDPGNGRNFEYHGEDPLLAGTITAQELRAIQDQGCNRHHQTLRAE